MLSESRPQNDDEKSSATTAKRFYSGLIPDPDATNSREELAHLEEIYNSIDKSLTDNKDANTKSVQSLNIPIYQKADTTSKKRTSEPTGGSCKNKCWQAQKKEDSCHCDPECRKREDCCEDISKHCPTKTCRGQKI